VKKWAKFACIVDARVVTDVFPATRSRYSWNTITVTVSVIQYLDANAEITL
jgi:hypothetical protein